MYINFDATQVAPNVGFAPVEAGKYTVVIGNSEFKPTSNGAGKILAISAIVQGGVNHGRSIMFNLNWENPSAKSVEIGRGQFSAICHAVNVLHVQDTQQLHNIPFTLEVTVTPDGKYNEVIGIFPVQQSGQIPNNMQPVQQAQPQQQFVQQQAYQPQPQQQYQPAGQVMIPQGQPQQTGYVQAGQVMQPQQFAQQPVQQNVVPMNQATGQANPMAQYEAMANPQPQQQFVQQQPVQQDQAPVPDWIANQMAAQNQAPMGNA